jgi:hypothetical protein
MNDLVQCRNKWCKIHKDFISDTTEEHVVCSHSVKHVGRKNCYQEDPGQRRQCPKCQPVEDHVGAGK